MDTERVANFWDEWRMTWQECTGRHLRLGPTPKEYMQMRELVDAYEPERLSAMCRLFLQSPSLAGKHNIGMLRSQAPALDRWLQDSPGVPFGTRLSHDQERRERNAASLAAWMAKGDQS